MGKMPALAVLFYQTLSMAFADKMTLVGDLSELAHGVSGTVYIKDESTLVVKHFTYDGQVRKYIKIVPIMS